MIHSAEQGGDPVAALEAVARRVSAGDRSAEGEFVRLTRFALWMILVRRGCSRDEAEDLAQEALIVAINRLRAGEIEDPARINGYLLRTALFIRRGNQRKLAESRTVYSDDSMDAFADEKADPLANCDRDQREQLLQRALGWLGQARDRELLRRHFLLQQDKREVCADLGLSAEHFDRVLHRAKQRLAELMRPWLK
ncbi:MAG: sigma-70 family RNA polymerase sigma factor [Xanthomonadales bacterium]|nr:sigma-70 family RNA polymerase sigma factor [Xanthomonadales bacterium]